MEKLLFELTRLGIVPVKQTNDNEIYFEVAPADFKPACLALHKFLRSTVMLMFAEDRRASEGAFVVRAGFIGVKQSQWFFVEQKVTGTAFASIAKEIYSANLFEREIKEMFGLEPEGNPDGRRLRLHDEVWPLGNYPLKKDFVSVPGRTGTYPFMPVAGVGVFEIPVGPVHAGIIGPGHFRFSVAGEPIINLESRLGFTHRGVEKLLEGRDASEAVKLSECVAGDAAFAHSLACCRAAERVGGIIVPPRAKYLRAIYLELERLYNHVADIGTIALDVGFTFPAAESSILKENLQALNADLTGSRFLKQVNLPGGVGRDLDQAGVQRLLTELTAVVRDFRRLRELLLASVSFLDRVETTGELSKKTAEDLGVIGLAGRASGGKLDLRDVFPGVYDGLKVVRREKGDVLARLEIRFDEFEESARQIERLAGKLPEGAIAAGEVLVGSGRALGWAESWRGPVLCWLRFTDGKIERGKIVDPSFHNWIGLNAAVQDNIIPDFPVCNKSFNLSYAGNDL
ncbi:MAG: NADH-quinone oxidoreductase subunit C [Candidatus Margulisiibacteriota bacterium]|jgi:Ni,Fe-hydrogenase III large subunit/NADH:ubiquinone oxidoreductase subunit C